MATTQQQNQVTDSTGSQNSTANTSNTGATTGNSTATTQANANPLVSSAVASNLGFVNNLQNTGFTPYSGPQVASFSPQQQSSFDMTNGIANNGTAPAATSMIDSYASAPAQNVSSNSIASNMSPYMNQYVMQALAPQLQQMDTANAAQNQATDAQATGSGAFGDARTGIQQANNQFNQGVQREGVIGNAYNSAFNTAIGAGAQDSSNQLAAQNANAGYAETALGRQLSGANALEGLQTQQLGVASAQNAAGQQQTAQQQAQLTANYNQWLMAQQYPFQTAALTNSTIGTAATATPASTTSTGANTGTSSQAGVSTANSQTQNNGTTNTTTQQPNNSGLALLGALGGGLLGNSGFGSSLGSALFGGGSGAIPGAVGPTSVGGAPLTYSDRDLKKAIAKIGELRDGTPVYSYRYFDDPENVTRIGLMAQDVEKRAPEAVHEAWPGGAKMVDYEAATALSRALAMAA